MRRINCSLYDFSRQAVTFATRAITAVEAFGWIRASLSVDNSQNRNSNKYDYAGDNVDTTA
jgi:hypothetical protein